MYFVCSVFNCRCLDVLLPQFCLKVLYVRITVSYLHLECNYLFMFQFVACSLSQFVLERKKMLSKIMPKMSHAKRPCISAESVSFLKFSLPCLGSSDMWPLAPPIRPLETLHNSLSLKQMNEFLDTVVSILFGQIF